MTNARPQKETGAVVNVPGGHAHSTATEPMQPSAAGCPTLHVELYRNTARLRGARIVPLLDEAGVTARMYDRSQGCWTIPAHLADDVMCIAEWRQRRFVTVEEVDR